MLLFKAFYHPILYLIWNNLFTKYVGNFVGTEKTLGEVDETARAAIARCLKSQWVSILMQQVVRIRTWPEGRNPMGP